MKSVLKVISTASILTALLVMFAVPTQAQTATQEANTTVNCTATSGNYGQSTNNCYSITNQNISQSSNRNVRLKHVPIAAGVDQTAAVAAVLTTGVGAVVTLKKIRG